MQKKAQKKATLKSVKAKIVKTTKKVDKIIKEDDKKYDNIRLYNKKREQMSVMQKEMDALKKQIIADKRAELAKNDKKQDDDYNFEKSQLDVMATKLAVMAKESTDVQMEKNIMDSVFVQLDDDNLANVEIDSGEQNGDQALGAQGALDDN